jgi:hypothetical protein
MDEELNENDYKKMVGLMSQMPTEYLRVIKRAIETYIHDEKGSTSAYDWDLYLLLTMCNPLIGEEADRETI